MIIEHRYLPESCLKETGQFRKIVTAVCIVRIDTGEVFEVETYKYPGKHGIITETRKFGECIIDNVLGALAEFGELGKNEELFWLDGYSYKGRFQAKPRVLMDVVIIGIDGNDIKKKHTPFDTDEITSSSWIKPTTLFAQPMREGGKDLFELILQSGWIEEFRKMTKANSAKKRIITSDFNVKNYCENRELTPDIRWQAN